MLRFDLRIAMLTAVACLCCACGNSQANKDLSDAQDAGIAETGTPIGDALTDDPETENSDAVDATMDALSEVDDEPRLACDPLPSLELRPLALAAQEGALVPGEVLEADLNAPVVLPATAGDEEFLLILFDLGETMDNSSDFEVTVERGGGGMDRYTPAHGVPADSDRFNHHPFEYAQDTIIPASPRSVPLEAEVGQILELKVPHGYIVLNVQAEVMLVTDSLVICNDITTDNPLDDVELETMQALADYFETLIQPRTHFFWGEESDVNEDGRVTMLFSHLVNQSGAYAFVTHCDLVDQAVCGYSNSQELIYVAISDPEEKINSPEAFAELIGHEFNHSVYFARKFLNNGATDSPENVYITEGMSGLAQDLNGFNRGNLFVAMAGLQGTDDISLPDLHKYDPQVHYFENRDGALRGASYLFLRYLFDQAGGENMDATGELTPSCGSQLLRNWVNSPLTGRDLVEEETGLDYEEAAVNWFTALALSNRPTADGLDKLPVDTVFAYLPTTTDPVTGNQRGVDLWGSVLGMIPLTGPTVRDVSQADGKIRSGGVEFLTVSAVEPGDVTITFDMGDAEKPGLRVVRIDKD